MRDLANHLTVRQAISPAAAIAANTPLVSAIVDLAGYQQALFAINVGALADADATFAVFVEHGDTANLSDASPVPDAQLTGTEAAAGFKFDDDNETRKIGYVGPKQFIRLTITPSANTGDAFISAVAILGSPRYWPAA